MREKKHARAATRRSLSGKRRRCTEASLALARRQGLLATEGRQALLATVLLATQVKHRAKTAHHRKASKEFSPLRQRVKYGGEKELSLSLVHVVPGRVQGKRLV